MKYKVGKKEKKVHDDLKALKSHFGLDLSYPLEMARKFYPDTEPKIVLAVNTFLDDSKNLVEGSIRSVLWIKDWDVTEGINKSKKELKHLASWIKENHSGLPIVLFYVVEDEIMDSLEKRNYPQLYNIKEIFQEKAVENGYQYLEQIRDVFAGHGMECEIYVRAGNLCYELGHVVGEKGTVLVGTNVMAQEVKKFVSNEIVDAPSDIVLASSPPSLEKEFMKYQDLSRVEKLKRFVSVDRKLRDVLLTDGGEEEKIEGDF